MTENTVHLYQNSFRHGFEKTNLKIEEIHDRLWFIVSLHESVTCRTLMKILSQDQEFYIRALMEPYLPDLIEKYYEIKDEKYSSKFDHLLFYWNAQGHTYKDGDRDFGIGLEVIGKCENDDENYGLTFAKLRDVLDVQIKIDPEVKVYDWDSKVYKEPVSYGDNIPTLLELLKAFVYEMTFCGSEEDKEAEEKELERRTKEAKDALERGDKDYFVSFDELRAKLEERKKKKE